MRTLLKNGYVFRDGVFVSHDLLLEDGVIVSISPNLPIGLADSVFFLGGCYLAPSFCDLHVHFRQPGYEYKETIRTGTLAAARGGFTTVCAMPNLNPPPDTLPHLEQQLRLIERDACVEVIPYGSITQGRAGGGPLSDMEALAPKVCSFSDDGTGVHSGADMKRAMRCAQRLGAIITAHAEDTSLIPSGGCVHDGALAKQLGLVGIPAESEWGQIKRDIALVRETGCRYHVCHLSSAESVALIREAKAQGLPVSCEVTPHNLLLCDEDLEDDGRFKMNPPIRSRADQQALLAGFLDGTIDVIATDHAPHSAEEKSKGLRDSVMGVVGLETAFSALYTHLVKPGRITLEALVDRLSRTPRELFGLSHHPIAVGQPLNAVLLDLNQEITVDPSSFLTMGRATPFAGTLLSGVVEATWCQGNIIYRMEGFHEGTCS